MKHLLGVLLLLVAGALPLTASRAQVDVPYENFPYNGHFTFVRVKFEPTRWGRGPHAWGLDLKWNHDYPTSEKNLMTILQHHSTLAPNMGKGNILGLDDPEIFKYPWAYLCEVGFWYPTDEEAENLRNYLLKGGFLVVDDFIMDWQLENFKEQMARVLPGYSLVELDASHPIFDSFFHIGALNFVHPNFPEIIPVYYGFFEDNDPKKRLMVIANYNNDVGEYWEWSGTGWVPIDISNEAFKFGVNYVIYGMTH